MTLLNPSLHKVSIMKITAVFAASFLLSMAVAYVLLPFFSESLVSIFAELIILLTLGLYLLHVLNKAHVPLYSITGKLSMDLKTTVFTGFLTVVKLLLYFSFAGLLLRLAFLSPNVLNQAESLLADSTEPAGLNLRTFFSGVLLAPVMEEFIFRGIILNKWADKRSNTRALVLSSLLFGLLHINTLIVPQFIGGLLYGLVYLKTKRLIYPIFMHMLYNALPHLLLLISVDESTETMPLSHSMLEELMTALNIISLVFIVLLPLFLFTLHKYSKNLNDEQIPFTYHILNTPTL